MTEGEREGMLDALVPAKLFGALTRYASSMTDEVVIDLCGTGLVSCCVDPAHIAVIETVIDKKALRKYNFEPGQILYDPGPVATFMSYADAAVVEVEAKDRKMSLHAPGMDLSLDTIDPVGTTVKSFDKMSSGWPLPAVVEEIDAQQLKRIVKHCETLGSVVELQAEKNKLTVMVDEEVKLKYTVVTNIIWGKDATKARSKYNLDYLSSIIKEIPDGAGVKIKLGTDYPLIIEWGQWGLDANDQLHTGKADWHIKSRFAVAPRIETVD